MSPYLRFSVMTAVSTIVMGVSLYLGRSQSSFGQVAGWRP